MLKLLGASAALAVGLPGCKRKPHREIVSRPEAGGLGGQSGVANPQLPGQVYHYASTWTEGPYPYGMLVKTVDGRPVKIDGNPDHPINRGATSPAMQAAILSLYDPDRLKGPLRRGKPVTWAQADEEIIAALKKAKTVVVMTRSNMTGWADQLLFFDFINAFADGHHFVHEVVADSTRRRVLGNLYGPGQVLPRFGSPIIVSFDCDFLGAEGPTLENIREFVAVRSEAHMSRFYAFESAVTTTSANADHRIPMRPTQMGPFALALRDLVHGKSVTVTGDCKPGQGEIEEVSGRCGIPGHVLASLVDDLARSEDCYFVAGSHLPASVHAAVELLNGVNPSMSAQSLEPGPDLPIPTDPREIQSILTGGVDVLILLGVNPVYDWPGGGEKFRTWMTKAGLTVGHGLYLDETLSACHLALPSNHELESWGYTQGRTNIHSLGQPVIQPLYDTRQEAESVFTWARELVDVETGSIIVEVDSWDDYRRRVLWKMLPLDLANWREKAALTTALTTATTTPVAAASQPASSQPASTQPVRHPPTAEDLAIRDALQTGGVFNSYPRSSSWGESFQRAKDEAERIASKDQPSTQPAGATGNNFELVILPHHAIYDGRFANNAWLQELPHPITRAVWGNFATISPATATQLGVVEGDVVRVTVVDRSVELPVLIQPGTADGVVVTTLGHGRTAGGAVALEAGGVNVAPLLGRENPDAPRVAFNVQVVKVEHPDTSAMHGQRNPGDAATDYRIKSPGEANRFPPVRTQKEFSQHGRAIALAGTLAEYREDPAGFVQRLRHHPLPKKIDTFTSPFDYAKGHRWAMAVDLSACVGCGACVIACQAENNIPVVGRDQCDIGRNMHWLRIDCYRSGSDPNNPAFHFQPMLCQQCDTAPCETVCPVNATAHMPEGINEMTYNRCVGTRYCQNNCPYKVRRFNFLRWHQFRLREAGQELMFNPQVSVRSVGVMEKCTFCIQRINEAKFRAFNQNRKIVDGEIQTACQQACPAGAIVFGDANDPTSRVAKLRQSPRAYHVLEELNTKPSVTYLAKISNSAVEDEPTK